MDLREELAELAGEARDNGAPAHELWDRGHRFAQRRRRGTAALALGTVLVLLGLGAMVELRSPAPAPVSPPSEGALGLPDRVWDPSPWLPGTEELGPIGPLAMLRHGERGSWWGTRDGVVGISARTGEYRFIDLPGDPRVEAADDGGMSLSPDGRKLAYWTSDGPTTQNVRTDEDGRRPATGVAIYDTTTGEVVRADLRSPHGLHDGQLVWADARTVVIERIHYRGGDGDDIMARSSGKGVPLLRWRPPGAPTRIGDGGTRAPGSNRRGTLTSDDGWTRIMTGPRAGARFRVRPAPNGTVLSPSATQAAYIRARRTPSALFVADVAGRPDNGGWHVGTPVGKRRWFNGVVGWVDERRVVVERLQLRSGRHDLMTVDVGTGREEVLVRDGASCCSGQTTTIATDLLGTPTYAAEEPPRPWDPRVVPGLALAVLLGGAVGVVVWRRRVAP